jgi:hypothetical protein
MPEAHATENGAAAVPSAEVPHCGIIMPLSDTEGYPVGHWAQVQRLIIRAAGKAGFSASMVSENLAEDMIQASIVRNVYHNEVVVCDVSSLNPNVMLELGLRMATLLPLVLVFDGEKEYPFDIRSILHVRYPKGLNIFRMEAFVDELAEKIQKVDEAQKNQEYQPFLSHFKEVKVEPAQLDTTSQNTSEALQTVLNEISSLKSQLQSVRGVPTGRLRYNGGDMVAEVYESKAESNSLERASLQSYAWGFVKELTRENLPERARQLAFETIKGLYRSVNPQFINSHVDALLPHAERFLFDKLNEEA